MNKFDVDVERINRDLDYAAIAQRFFAPAEYTYLCALPAVLQPLAFFTCWTRKEAFIKAHGEGLSLPLDQFVVTMDAGKPARLLQTVFAPAEVDRWLLNELRPGAGYAAALAVEGRGWRLSSFDLRPHP